MSYLLTEKLTSTLVVWMILKRVLKPFKDWEAAKLGIISPIDGKRIRRPRTAKERESFDILDRFCWQLKRLTSKYLGDSKIPFLFSLAYLMKESYVPVFKNNIDRYKTELETLEIKEQQLLYEIILELDKRNVILESHIDLETNALKIKDTVQNVLKIFIDRIQSIKKASNIQCSDGNWNYDPYMHGMANGLLLSLGLLKGEPDIQFLDAPEEWIKDKEMTKSLTIHENDGTTLGDVSQMILPIEGININRRQVLKLRRKKNVRKNKL